MPNRRQRSVIFTAREWRGLGLELLVVVVGVLIALGVGELADGWRWRGNVATGRAIVIREVEGNNTYYAMRIAIAPCLARRLAAIQRDLDRVAIGRKPESPEAASISIGEQIDNQAWEALRASQTLAHFRARDLIAFGAIYSQQSAAKHSEVDRR